MVAVKKPSKVCVCIDICKDLCKALNMLSVKYLQLKKYNLPVQNQKYFQHLMPNMDIGKCYWVREASNS